MFAPIRGQGAVGALAWARHRQDAPSMYQRETYPHRDAGLLVGRQTALSLHRSKSLVGKLFFIVVGEPINLSRTTGPSHPVNSRLVNTSAGVPPAHVTSGWIHAAGALHPKCQCRWIPPPHENYSEQGAVTNK